MSKTKLQPLHGIIAVRRYTESQSKGGIHYATDKVLDHGEVVAHGPGEYWQDGTYHEVQVKVGDEIVVAPGAGIVLDIDGEPLLFITQNDIEGIVRKNDS